jgi:hypothetical protein
MVHAILGVRAPPNEREARIATVAWTVKGRVDDTRVNIR